MAFGVLAFFALGSFLCLGFPLCHGFLAFGVGRYGVFFFGVLLLAFGSWSLSAFLRLEFWRFGVLIFWVLLFLSGLGLFWRSGVRRWAVLMYCFHLISFAFWVSWVFGLLRRSGVQAFQSVVGCVPIW